MAGARVRELQSILALKNAEMGRTYNYSCNLQGVRIALLGSTAIKVPMNYYSKVARCEDETHVPLHIKHPRKGKQGGPFDLRKVSISNAVSREYTIRRNCYSEYRGRFYANRQVTETLLPFDDWRTVVSGYGPVGWNKFRPGRPEVSMGTFLGELRDLPSMLKQTCQLLLKSWRVIKKIGSNPLGMNVSSVSRRFGPDVANNFLLYQFGWAPFLGDLLKCYETSKRIDHLLNEIRSNNGRLRRRGGTLMRQTTTNVLEDGPRWDAVWPMIGTTFYSQQPRLRVVQVDEDKIWFKGAFRYWIPDMGTLQWKRRTKRLLYGLTLNAEVVWNLIPWSWLIDWFVKVSENFSSLDDGWADNLTAKYAYVMGYRKTTITSDALVNFVDGQSLRMSTEILYESKQRVHATPYGFGISWESLSPKRLAILAALGMTRLDSMRLF